LAQPETANKNAGFPTAASLSFSSNFSQTLGTAKKIVGRAQ